MSVRAGWHLSRKCVVLAWICMPPLARLTAMRHTLQQVSVPSDIAQAEKFLYESLHIQSCC